MDTDVLSVCVCVCVGVCVCMGFPGGASGKEQGYQCRDIRDSGSIPGSRRSSGEGHGNPLQYSCQQNFMDRGAWQPMVHGFSKSPTWLKWLGMHTFVCICVCVCVCIYIYTHKQKISHKKNEILLFTATCMDLENILLSEMSKTNTYSITYIWNL